MPIFVQYVSPNQSGGQEPQHHHVHSEVDCHECLEDEDGDMLVEVQTDKEFC